MKAASKAGSRGQSSMEFVLLVAVVMLMVLTLFSIASENLAQRKLFGAQEQAKNIALTLVREVSIASEVSSGYERTFVLPASAEGDIYTITLTDMREVAVNVSGFEYVAFLPMNVTGVPRIGENVLKKPAVGNLTLNPN